MGERDIFRFGTMKQEDFQHLMYLKVLMATITFLFASYIGLLVLQWVVNKRYGRRRKHDIPRGSAVLNETECVLLQEVSTRESRALRQKRRESWYVDNVGTSRDRQGMIPHDNNPNDRDRQGVILHDNHLYDWDRQGMIPHDNNLNDGDRPGIIIRHENHPNDRDRQGMIRHDNHLYDWDRQGMIPHDNNPTDWDRQGMIPHDSHPNGRDRQGMIPHDNNPTDWDRQGMIRHENHLYDWDHQGMIPHDNHHSEEQDHVNICEVSTENDGQADKSFCINLSTSSNDNRESRLLPVSGGSWLNEGIWENNNLYVGHDLPGQSETVL
ncbi:uncharacterized protein LOC124255101 [Haliotis rubra]|uniref:uncharacterized protein LOC124255101 n=1 Tax=Haliotis rubra TaxID=36100 RepID=UPI001EE60C4C|nr:uncharacterized protein LOC124255101 [Haliotis rubra]